MSLLYLPPPVVDAEPLVLRRIRESDAEELAQALSRSLEHLRPWMAWAGTKAGDVEAQRRRLGEAERRWDHGDHRYVMWVGGTVVGGCGLHRRVGPGGIEIGYWVHVDHIGRGYALAAARALTGAALALPDLTRVEVRCDLANVRSQAIPRRLGYRLDRIEPSDPVAPAETGTRMIWVMDRPGRDSGRENPRYRKSGLSSDRRP